MRSNSTHISRFLRRVSDAWLLPGCYTAKPRLHTKVIQQADGSEAIVEINEAVNIVAYAAGTPSPNGLYINGQKYTVIRTSANAIYGRKVGN